MTDSNPSYIVQREGLPADFPTHLHAPAFWEELGRTVATFGFLEETLGKAIFAFSGTREVDEEDVERELEGWSTTLERALSDPLGGLIDLFGKTLRENKRATISNANELIGDLRKAAAVRNVLCHGSWRLPDASGASVPLFVNKRMDVFVSRVDLAYLRQTRAHVVDLVCSVIDTVTHMGYQFPGSRGPGTPIWRASQA